MALTGLQIQKLLPGTNCKDCGSNTCMAFAMKLAAGELGTLVLNSQRVVPAKLLAHQFSFHYPTIDQALTAAMSTAE